VTSCEASGLLWYQRTQTAFPYDYFKVEECGDPLTQTDEASTTMKVISQVFDYNAYLKGVEYPYLYQLDLTSTQGFVKNTESKVNVQMQENELLLGVNRILNHGVDKENINPRYQRSTH